MKTMEQIPGVHQALTNKSILSRIFDLTESTTDLLNYRLVSQLWNRVSCIHLRQRNSCEIILKEEGTRCSTFCSRRPENALNLKCLNVVLSSTLSLDKFPCQNFKFISGKLDGAPELERLFNLYGYQMKEMIITRFCQVTPHFFQLIFKHAPNLESLHVQSFSEVIDGCEDPLSNEGGNKNRNENYHQQHPIISFQNLDDKFIIFHELHTLDFGLPFSTKAEIILSSLLRSAVNLQIVKGLNMKFITAVCKLKKIHLIRELIFNPSDNNMHLFHQLSMEHPKLTKLHIKFARINSEQQKSTQHSQQGHEMATTSLNGILVSSKWTLKFLDIAPLCSIQGIQIPTLRNVKCLILRENRRCYPDLRMQLIPKAIFPPSTVFQQKLPNLQTVSLHLKEYDAINLNAFFPEDYYNEDDFGVQVNNPFLTVTNLEVDLFTPNSFGVKALARKFPNIKNFRLGCGDAFQLNDSIWELPLSVESIELYGIYVNSSRPLPGPAVDPGGKWTSSVCSWIDAFFTGIPQDVCKSFRRFPRTMRDKQLIELLREKPSICRLQNLRQLKIFVQGWNSSFFSTVSSDYAFKMLPKLNIYFAHDHKKWNCVPAQECEKLLEEIRPFVEFISPIASVSFCNAYLSL